MIITTTAKCISISSSLPLCSSRTMITPSTNIPSWKQTEDPYVSPKKGRHIRDKLETSPNSRAKCQGCGIIIQKGQSRVGIQGNIRTRQGNLVWRPRYYHESCVSEVTKRKLHLEISPRANNHSSANSTTTAASSEAEQSQCRNTISPAVQKQLKSDLHNLRKNLAKQQNLAPCQIFPNRTLEEIIAKLPTNHSELVKIYRIKERRCDLYGDAILEVVNTHLDGLNHESDSRVQRSTRRENNGMSNNSETNSQTKQTELIDLT